MRPSHVNAICLILIMAACAGFAKQPSPTNLWALYLPFDNANSSPAIAPDGTIYQATFEGNLLAVTPQGRKKWVFQINSEIKSSPAIGDDGTIYFGARDRHFYAVTPEGKLKWVFATGAWVDSSPSIGADGTIYFGSWDTNFYALNPNGTIKWVFPSGGIIDSSPAIGADGTIYFGSHDKKFYALNPDGTKKWDFATAGQIISSPAIGVDGLIYFTSTDGNLYVLRPDGTERLRVHTGSSSESSPILDNEGNIYVSVGKFNVSFDNQGKQRWYYGVPVPTDATPALTANGLVYFAASWRTLTALQTTNGSDDLWHVDVRANIVSSPVIGEDGTVYICDGCFLSALNTPGGLPPLLKSSWPMFRANPRHTGRVQMKP